MRTARRRTVAALAAFFALRFSFVVVSGASSASRHELGGVDDGSSLVTAPFRASTFTRTDQSVPSPPDASRRRLAGWVGLRGGGLVDLDHAGNDQDRAERAGNRVPRIIHLLWKTRDLPSFSLRYTQSWIDNHPGWRVIQWTDADMLDFVREHFPRDVNMWNGFPTGVFRADTFRYMVLRVMGGVYVDLDMESLRPLDALLEGHTCLVGQEPSAHALLLVNKPRNVCNAWMASAVGEPFWLGGVAPIIQTHA